MDGTVAFKSQLMKLPIEYKEETLYLDSILQ